ncbi:MAG: type II 3-dehydroquinate dehydratase, partial [Candidatus Omnitrophica bacterium]|nr:type II 3-dehydroquinate dehydratase [Candidatus Omnitrophota bacterium]
ILVIHGPNLHLLGKREPQIYGNVSLSQINKEIQEAAKKHDCVIEIMQSNSEGDIVEAITTRVYNFLIINPAAYTHTSVAIRDAIAGVDIPAIEVHLSNIYKREQFRKKSLISDIVVGIITGLGPIGYLLAISAAREFLTKSREDQ